MKYQYFLYSHCLYILILAVLWISYFKLQLNIYLVGLIGLMNLLWITILIAWYSYSYHVVIFILYIKKSLILLVYITTINTPLHNSFYLVYNKSYIYLWSYFMSYIVHWFIAINYSYKSMNNISFTTLQLHKLKIKYCY